MKMLIKEFADFTGVSVRTLHYYDEIGLLTPSYVDEQTGYRYYDGICLERMQEILFYRELDFPLKNICELLSSPGYDKQKALEQQKRLLVLKKERLERLIDALDSAKRGEYVMTAFDNKEYEKSLDLLNRLSNINPSYNRELVWFIMGHNYKALKNNELAKQYYMKVFLLAPQNQDFLDVFISMFPSVDSALYYLLNNTKSLDDEIILSFQQYQKSQNTVEIK